MTPERQAELEAAREVGRRAAQGTIALMERQLERHAELLPHGPDPRESLAEYMLAERERLAAREEERRRTRGPRLVAVDGALVDGSAWRGVN